jgi:hypothetical protein
VTRQCTVEELDQLMAWIDEQNKQARKKAARR